MPFRAERVSLVLSIIALLCAVAALAVPAVALRTPRNERLMRLAGPLEHFSDKQFDAIVELLDRAAKMGSKALTDEALQQMDTAMKQAEQQSDSPGGFMNPAKELSDARNAQRRADVNTILNAVYQYAIDNNGSLPEGITSTPTEVCAAQDSAECSDLMDLHVLLESYLVSIPRDPQNESGPGSGYFIVKDENSRITVSAPGAENGMEITVTR